MIILVLLGYGVIVLVDTIPIYKDGTRKEFWVSTIILTFSFICSVLLVFGVELPSPAKPLEEWVLKILG